MTSMRAPPTTCSTMPIPCTIARHGSPPGQDLWIRLASEALRLGREARYRSGIGDRSLVAAGLSSLIASHQMLILTAPAPAVKRIARGQATSVPGADPGTER